MTSFQRMIVIPQEEYLAMTTVQNVKEPLTQHFYNTENRYEQDANVRDPYRRLVMQSATLDEMKLLKEQMRNSLGIATPKPYRNRAKGLFQFIEHSLRFNEKGEVYDNNNQVISGSRVEDLIQYAVNDRRRSNLRPEGWNTFLELLRDKNVPRNFLNRYTMDELEGKVTTAPVATSSTPTSVSAPTARKRIKQVAKRRRIQPERNAKSDIEFLKYFITDSDSN